MKALIICTSVEAFPLKGTKTGAWFGEVVHYYDVLLKRKVEMDFASPAGGEIPLDPRSLDSKDEIIRRYRQDNDFMNRLKTALPLDGVDASQYKILYLVGGMGPHGISLMMRCFRRLLPASMGISGRLRQ